MNIFKNIFNRKHKEETKEIIVSTGNTMKTYDIVVLELDDKGNRVQHEERGVKAENPSQLISLYKQCGQDIRILKEYPGPNAIASQQVKQSLPNEKKENNSQTVPIRNTNAAPQAVSYFTVGGVQCKLENGKVFQKQWVKLLPQESTNIRVIADSNNKEINMNGKHIEMLKWISTDSTIENSGNTLING